MSEKDEGDITSIDDEEKVLSETQFERESEITDFEGTYEHDISEDADEMHEATVLGDISEEEEPEISEEDGSIMKLDKPEKDESPFLHIEGHDLPPTKEGTSFRSNLELEEMPRDDDVTAEELELNEPLDEWIADLMPGMRELIAPQSFPSEEPLEDVEEEQTEPELCRLPQVMISESPMMIRFQNTLRAHLIRQKDKLESDIQDMELKCNQKNKEVKDIGVMMNKDQEHLIKQRDLMEKFKGGLVEMSNKRKQFDIANTKKNEEFKEIETTYKEWGKEDKYLLQQHDEMNELAFRLAEMEEAQNNELKFAKNISDKQRSDRIKMAQEKQTQDLYIWKLSQELERLNLETQALIEGTELKKKEISELTVLITNIDADTEALRKENSMIICATQQLVQEIKMRDKAFQESTDKVSRVHSELNIILARVRSYNKSLNSEAERKLKLQSKKNKLEVQLQKNKTINQSLHMRHDELLGKVAEIQNMIDFIELQMKSKNSDHGDLVSKLASITTEIDELVLKKIDLKNRYMQVMSDVKIQSAVTKKLQKDMEDLSHENQDISLRKLEVDCKIGELMTEIEHSKVSQVHLEAKIDNLKNTIKDKESVLQSLEVRKKKIHQKIETFKSKVIGSKKRLENLNKFNDDSDGQNQLARRVKILETELATLDTKINEVKQMWMATQNTLIENTYKLSQLESTTNTIRKHLFLTKYKREKLENKMHEVNADIKKAEKESSLFYNKLTSMSLENYRHEQAKEKMSEMAKETETKFILVLKDAEENAVSLQNEICNLEEINIEMSDDITRLQREFLAWEKKWKMAVQARERVEKERAATGEIGAMKLEIHRMQVRYSQLKRAQEKLSQDLELCISRRDNIMDLALAKEKRLSSSKASYSREQFNKKLDSIKLKIKQLHNSIKHSEKDIEELELRREELINEYVRKQKQLSEVKLGVEKLETEIQEGQLHKYKSLELIVRRQRKIRLLDDVKHSRYRLFCRNESHLPHEEDKQESIGNNLLEIVQYLIGDFPKLKLQLLQIYNTLTSPLE